MTGGEDVTMYSTDPRVAELWKRFRRDAGASTQDGAPDTPVEFVPLLWRLSRRSRWVPTTPGIVLLQLAIQPLLTIALLVWAWLDGGLLATAVLVVFLLTEAAEAVIYVRRALRAQRARRSLSGRR